MIETIESGKPTTPFMKAGDTVEIEMRRRRRRRASFGTIEQTVVDAR